MIAVTDMNDERKLNKLYGEYLEAISSSDHAEDYLREEGFDPNVLVNEGLKYIKKIKMKIASEQTAQAYQQIKVSLLDQAKQKVDQLLSNAGFNIEGFIKQENIMVAYKNFDKMTLSEVREFLERHYLLKLKEENKEK